MYPLYLHYTPYTITAYVYPPRASYVVPHGLIVMGSVDIPPWDTYLDTVQRDHTSYTRGFELRAVPS